jgi:uncharacterized membrane protein
MKKFIIVTLVLAVLAGGGIFGYMMYQNSQNQEREFNPEFGKVLIKIGPFEDSVEFMNDSKSLTSEFDIEDRVFDVCLEARGLCNNPDTFEPMSCRIRQKGGDTLELALKFSASNAYGVSSEGTVVSYHINDSLVNTIAF